MSDFLQQTKKKGVLKNEFESVPISKEETSVQQRTANRDKLKEAGTSFRENRRWVEKYI